MKNLGINEIRETFLTFFETKQHLRMESFSLVPYNDKSLLLINSGMAPLKPYFTGQEIPPNKRVATCQKCIRTGDIENVGKTARHGTFFEMLGNFSFGDYFKEEVIPWAWEFVTEVLEMPLEKLYVSIYEDDDEAFAIWNEKIGLSPDRIFRMGKDDNFWEVGIGPCGPCSEIYYDRGEKFGCGQDTCTVGCDCDRFIEFWNLVFTQFSKEEDGSYSKLANPNIDTGMGLERMGVIMQDVFSIFDVDTVKAVRDEVCKIAEIQYLENKKRDISIRVITDHIRSVTFMMADGVLPSNEGRGYVLRRLIRRAVRHGKLLGIQNAFLEKLCAVVIETSKEAYPALFSKKDYIRKALAVEEERFHETIDKGMEILKENIESLKKAGQNIMKGETSFKLYDTFGFPVDLTQEILLEEGITFDQQSFEEEMAAQRRRAQLARGENTFMGAAETVFNELDKEIRTEFVGYDSFEIQGATVKAIIVKGEIVSKAEACEDVAIILDKTTFYAEGGGQIGDRGDITGTDGKMQVQKCIMAGPDKIAHIGILEGSVSVGDEVRLCIDKDRRLSTARNHSATHLLQQALRDVLGSHVEQAGSLVTDEKLRFDFTHFASLTTSEIKKVENIVNGKILDHIAIRAGDMSMQDARELGAMALFGEKYGDQVRVVDMGGYSIELCKGSHLQYTSQIGSFKIISEGGISAGVRRIEAATGKNALTLYDEQDALIKQLSNIVKSPPDMVIKKVEQILADQKEMLRTIEKIKSKAAASSVEAILMNKEVVNGVDIIVTDIDDKTVDEAALRNMGDALISRLTCGIALLAVKNGGKVSFVAKATDSAVAKGIHCGLLVKEAAAICGGGGGGRPNMAQAGGKKTEKLSEALARVKEMISLQV